MSIPIRASHPHSRSYIERRNVTPARRIEYGGVYRAGYSSKYERVRFRGDRERSGGGDPRMKKNGAERGGGGGGGGPRRVQIAGSAIGRSN